MEIGSIVCQFLIGNVQQQHLSAIFFIILLMFLKINHFTIKKYVDLFYVRVTTTRMVTGFSDIFLISENRVLRSTYFLIHYKLFLLNKTPFFTLSHAPALLLMGWRSMYFFVILGFFRFYGNFLKYLPHIYSEKTKYMIIWFITQRYLQTTLKK